MTWSYYFQSVEWRKPQGLDGDSPEQDQDGLCPGVKADRPEARVVTGNQLETETLLELMAREFNLIWRVRESRYKEQRMKKSPIISPARNTSWWFGLFSSSLSLCTFFRLFPWNPQLYLFSRCSFSIKCYCFYPRISRLRMFSGILLTCDSNIWY